MDTKKINDKTGVWKKVGFTHNSFSGTIEIPGWWPGSENIAVFVREKSAPPEITVGDAVELGSGRVRIVVRTFQLNSTFRVSDNTGRITIAFKEDVTAVHRNGEVIWKS